MAVTNETLSAQISGLDEKVRGLDEKVGDFIGVQRQCNDAQGRRLRAVETEQARTDERVSQLRNIFGGIQLMVGGILAWLGLR